MAGRQVVLWSAFWVAVVVGGAILVYQHWEPKPETSATAVTPIPKRAAASKANLDEIRGYLDAEKVEDDFQRCLGYPNPVEFKWDPKVVEALCRLWQRKMISYEDIRVAIEQHHPKVLQEAFDSYLERTYQPGEHGFLVWSYRWMFQNWSKEEGELLDKWVEEDPRSAYALTARGVHFVAVAFHERGTEYASQTSADQFTRMREYAAKARTDLEEAVRRSPRLIAAYHGLLGVAQLQSDGELFASSSKAAMTLDPADQAIYEDLMDIVEPKWGGSLEQMRALAESASKQVDKNPLLVLIPARIPCSQAERLVCSECGSAGTIRQRAGQALELYRAAARFGPEVCLLTDATYSAEQAGDDISLARYYSQAYRFLGGNKRILNRALVLQRLGKADWALEGLDRILKAQPRNVDAFVHRGYVLMAESLGREAQQAFASAYAIDPTNWDATRNLVNAYDNLVHEPAKAREIVDRMMAETPRNPRVWLLEASLHKNGEEAKCRNALKKYLELVDPKTTDATDKYEIERAKKRITELDKQLGA